MTSHPVKRRKKLIEVAIPLEAINAASAREKNIRHGHPSTLHLWWAPRPLAAARAVIFCQMVDDPSSVPEEFPTEDDQENDRLRLFALISELVQWENTTNEQVLDQARHEIRRSWRRACADNADHPKAAALFNPEKLPGFHDPFAGGGALPLEAQRLGLESYASDLNPVAVLINKAKIEIPSQFAGMPPVNPDSRHKLAVQQWNGAQGLVEDVRYYSKWMIEEAEKRIGHLYPKVEVTAEMIKDRPDLSPHTGKKLTVIAWIWARTVKSPNPAFTEIEVPLCTSFWLSSKSNKSAQVTPLIEESNYSFIVQPGNSADLMNGTKTARGANFRCIMSGSPISSAYIKAESKQGRLGARLLAIVADTGKERIYLSPMQDHEINLERSATSEIQDLEIQGSVQYLGIKPYGIRTFRQIYTDRQATALLCFSDLVKEVTEVIIEDGRIGGLNDQTRCEYASSVAVYLAFCVDKLSLTNTTQATWQKKPDRLTQAFGRQALPMTWDYAEANPFSDAGGGFSLTPNSVSKVLLKLPLLALPGKAAQCSATHIESSGNKIISTDPPYYDNVPYADLSDYFYIWLRRSLRDQYPELLSTISAPKAEELVAFSCRHEGDKVAAEDFFLQGMRTAVQSISSRSHPAYPITIYYAFRQTEKKGDRGRSSTGWETFLEAVAGAGLEITGTWPVRTELTGNLKKEKSALASSLVLVCRKRGDDAPSISRSEFKRLLKIEVPAAVHELEISNIAPVDISQAVIGPGMSAYSRFGSILNPDDTIMSVRDGLTEINTVLDEYLSQDEGDLDADSRFALTFFESYGYEERPYGDAEGLAIARNLSVDGVAEAGILSSVAGKVRLYQRAQLPDDWDPTTDRRLCVWEATQHLIKRLEASGENSAAELLHQLKNISGHGDLVANCRALAYRLYNHCEKKKEAEEARAYNGLVIAWPELERLASASSTSSSAPRQTTLI